MVNPTQKIKAIIDELATDYPPSKARNKTIARLEEAELWSTQIVHSPTEPQTDVKCICPAGAIDAQCPVHGTI
jgi:hypothetical protein